MTVYEDRLCRDILCRSHTVPIHSSMGVLLFVVSNSVSCSILGVESEPNKWEKQLRNE